MSYDLGLYKDGESVDVVKHSEGGTYVLGGTICAELNVTYNYAEYFYLHLDSEKGIRWLYGQKASDTISRLAKAITELGTRRDPDYWRATAGNAGYALSTLLIWAEQHLDAVWEGD